MPPKRKLTEKTTITSSKKAKPSNGYNPYNGEDDIVMTDASPISKFSQPSSSPRTGKRESSRYLPSNMMERLLIVLPTSRTEAEPCSQDCEECLQYVPPSLKLGLRGG